MTHHPVLALSFIPLPTTHFLLRFPATTVPPGQDKPAPSGPMSRASCVVVSCGVRLPEDGLSEIRKPLVGCRQNLQEFQSPNY